MANKISQRQVVSEIRPVVVPGCPTGPTFDMYFAQVSGGEVTAAVEKIYDGGILFPEVLTGPPEIGDVTVTRHYDADRDGPALRLLRNKVGQVHYDVAIFDLNCDLVVYGTERVYPKALLVGLSEPEGDSSSGAPTTFSLTFSISAVSGQTVA